MSMSPPPGWYTDPSAPPAQHVERWWDGSAWTEHRRAPAQPVVSGGGGRAKAVALAAAGVVLVAAIVTGVVILGKDDDAPEAGAPAPSTSEPVDTSSPTSPTPTTSAPDPDPANLVDQLNGITIPVPDGWEKADSTVGGDPTVRTPDTYDCPGEGSLCRHGTVYSRTATGTDERSPKALALGDIKEAADGAYDEDRVGMEPFDGIVSHQKVKAGTVAVAGRSGYYVRWRVRTKTGPGGYVQSLAFPSSAGSEAMVIVRFAIDAESGGSGEGEGGADGEGPPPLTDMDKITKGIRAVGGGATSGGVGNSVGATP
ncbi:DUF2510 domain-containing protein [Streptomyces sp. NPDC048441]|uniref:DUF2510 domain-containing protein n=1 Tax=Streptomyces sp. NPDC048441 TaxID=3365552 RepID=UPI0037243BEA